MSQYYKTTNRLAAPIKFGDQTITLVEKDVRIQPPGLWGLFFWRRPAAVLVDRPGMQRQVLAIPDVTRIAQLSVLGAGLLVVFIVWLLSLPKQES